MIKREFIKFAMVGSLSAGLNIAGLFILTDYVGLHYLVSTVITGLVANLVGFYLNKRLTFLSHDFSRKKVVSQFSKYNLVYVVGFFLAILLMYIFVDLFNIWYITAYILATILMLLFNYTSHKFITFSDR